MRLPRSAPEQKALPVPVTTATRMPSSPTTSVQASSRRHMTSGLMAFRTSGRLSVISATWPIRSISTTAIAASCQPGPADGLPLVGGAGHAQALDAVALDEGGHESAGLGVLDEVPQVGEA